MIDEIFIIGKGSSLEGFDFERLRDKTTLCLNHAVFNVPDPDYLLFVDKSFYIKFRNFVDNFEGIVLAAISSKYKYSLPEIERDFTRLSGLLGIHLALEMAKKIYLLGYDMHTTTDYPYFNKDMGEDDYERWAKKDGGYRLFYQEGFWINSRLKIFEKKFSQYRDRIFNCNKGSAVKTFDFVDVEDVL